MPPFCSGRSCSASATSIAHQCSRFRFFGLGRECVVDVQHENAMFALLSLSGIAPKTYAASPLVDSPSGCPSGGRSSEGASATGAIAEVLCSAIPRHHAIISIVSLLPFQSKNNHNQVSGCSARCRSVCVHPVEDRTGCVNGLAIPVMNLLISAVL
jgi:hypothetical protein